MIASDLTSETVLTHAESSATLGAVPAASALEEKSRPVLLPQTLGRLFDEAFDLYKTHFAVLALIVALVFIPTQIGLHAVENLWLTPLSNQIRSEATEDNFFPLAGTFVLGLLTGSPGSGVPGLLSLLVSYLISGPISLAVADILLGRSISVRAAYRKSGVIMWRLFWGWLLIMLAFICMAVVCLIVLSVLFVFVLAFLQTIGVLQAGGGGAEIGIFFLILLILCPYLVGCLLTTYFFAFTAPLVALEGLPVKSVLSRNSQLIGKKMFWRVAAAITFLPVVTFGLQFLIMWGLSSLVNLFKFPPWLDFLSSATIACMISCFFQPYWMIFLTLLYFDARMRREGLDTRLLADNLRRSAASSLPAADRFSHLPSSNGSSLPADEASSSSYRPSLNHAAHNAFTPHIPQDPAQPRVPSIPPLPGNTGDSIPQETSASGNGFPSVSEPEAP